MLEFPLHDGFFPQITLSREEVKYYKRLGKERVTQLIRIIEDADCAYKWSIADGASHRSHKSRFPSLSLDNKDDVSVPCYQANFLDFQPMNKSAQASTLLKASIQLPNTTVDEVLRAVAKNETKDFRKAARYMHGDAFVDGRTLFNFPQPSTHAKHSYRAIKWHAYKTQRSRHGEAEKLLDFCYLEYAGKKKPHPGSNVVGFCIQESISRDREVPTLENFGIARGYLSRMGVIVSKTHQLNTFKVTSICQIDGDLNPIVRRVLEEVMQKTVCAVARIAGLVTRQRVSSLRFVEQWQWVPNSDRKACAVCLRGFYFRRKHHCRTCGEVVCSSCALLRELEEPIFDITHLRVCSACMTNAGAHGPLAAPSATGTGNEPASSTSNDTESYIRGLRSPQHNSYEDTIFQMRESRDRDRRQSDLASEVLERVETEEKSAMLPRPPGKSPLLRAQDKLLALTEVVGHIRQVRDTINLTMSEAADGERHEEMSNDTKEFNDMYSEITSIRDALESSVTNFDAALANATNAAPAMYYSGPSDRSLDSYRANDCHQEGPMTPDQFNSVARITFAAARATRQAGQAFLAVGERHAEHTNHTGVNQDEYNEAASVNSASTSDPTKYDSDDQDPDPYSASNYEKIMATYQPEHVNCDQEDEDEPPVSHRFVDSVRRTADIYKLEKKIEDLQRCLQIAQQKLAVIDREEPEPEAKSRQKLEAVRECSAQMEIESVFEIFGDRDEDKKALLDDKSSCGSRTLLKPSDDSILNGATQDLVSELRGVMASSETPVGASGTPRKLLSRSSTPLLPSRITKSPPHSPLPPLEPLDNNLRHSLPAKPNTGIPNSAHNVSSKGNKKSPVRSPYQASVAGTEESYLQALGTTYGDDSYASMSSEDISEEDSSDNLSLLSSQDNCNPPLKRPETFFVEENLDALLQKRKTVAIETPFLQNPATLSPTCVLVERDERDELRELMAGLVRPRSSSVPFQSGQMGGVSSGEPLHGFEKASWSDDARDRNPMARQVDETVHEIRSCLASCRCECPSDSERARKLTSIFKVLRSLHREGVRSKFRTLQHDDIRYSKMLQATPSIIKLLKLAGYVSLQQKLMMRRVDQDYLALFLKELEHELHVAE